METIIFSIVAVVFVVGAVILYNKWFKEEPKLVIPNTNVGGSQDESEQPNQTVIGWLNVANSILFGKDGELTKGETFFEGKTRKNSQIYIRLNIGMNGSAVLCGINDCATKPRLQIAVQYGEKQCIANPCNSHRQSVQPYMIHNGESIWVSSDVLNGITLPDFFVLRILYRIDNGNGYGSWQMADVINVQNTKK